MTPAEIAAFKTKGCHHECYDNGTCRSCVDALLSALEEAKAKVGQREVEIVGLVARAQAAESRADALQAEVEDLRERSYFNAMKRMEARADAAWRAALEAAAKSCEEEAEMCVEAAGALDLDEEDGDQVFAQNILLDQAGRIRLLPAPSATDAPKPCPLNADGQHRDQGGPFLASCACGWKDEP